MDYSYDYGYGDYGASAGDGGVGLAMLAGFGMVYFFALVIFYVYFAVCLMVLAKKLNVPNGWWAWVPILNVVLFLNLANKPLWWLLLFFVPVVNFVMPILVFMEIAKLRGKPDWVGILLIVPGIGFFVPAYLAFAD